VASDSLSHPGSRGTWWRDVIGDLLARHSGRLELTWADKGKALLSSADGKYDYTFADRCDPRVLEVRLLHEIDRFDVPVPKSRPVDLPTPTSDNLLITGDAMHALDALRKTPEWAAKYVGKVKLIYIDPPFNTGQTFTSYDDNIDHSVWLTMLRDRIKQLAPLLAEDGSIWVHLDDVEVHRCRAVMDEEFGAEKFIATIVWEKDKGRRNDTDVSSAHDYLLVYAPLGKKWKNVRNLLPRAGQEARYKNPDNDPRGRWLQGDNGTAKSGTDKNRYEVEIPSGRVVTPGKNYWRFSRETLEEARAEGRVWFGKDGDSLPVIKRYLSQVQEGLVPRTWWTADEAGHNQEAKRDHINKMFPEHEEGFATPKPERLLQRVIHIATDPGDIVLDCYAGSGTTAAVAHKMGRRWVTSELLPDTVVTFTKQRLLKVLNNEDPRGITTTTVRVPADGVTIPKDVTPKEAQEFQTTLGRVLDNPLDDVDATPAEPLTIAVDRRLASAVRAAQKAGNETLSSEETRTLLAVLKKLGGDESLATLDITKHVKSELTKRTLTRNDTSVIWHGGGGFTHLTVGPSMYDVDLESGDVFLSEAAVNGTWSRSVAAQLKFKLTPDHPVFCGVRGKQRLAVLDGVADDIVVRTVVEHLAEQERAVIVAKVVLPDSEVLLHELSPGSRLKKAPRDLFPKRTVK
jgi:adenine-specific DNA-methyltransferase